MHLLDLPPRIIRAPPDHAPTRPHERDPRTQHLAERAQCVKYNLTIFREVIAEFAKYSSFAVFDVQVHEQALGDDERGFVVGDVAGPAWLGDLQRAQRVIWSWVGDQARS